MDDLLSMVKEFHIKFGFDLPKKPQSLIGAQFITKAGHLVEESLEYLQSTDDPVKQLDALVDVVYVALGAACLSGYPFYEAFREVHRANMSKERAIKPSDSSRNSIFDVIKPKDFIPPDIERIIKNALNVEINNK